MVNSFGVIATSAITFFTVPIYTATLGVDYYSLYATWFFAIVLLQFVDLGYSTTIIHFGNDNSDNATSFYSKVLAFELIILFFILFIGSLFVFYKMPKIGIYEKIGNEIGDYALFLFFFPILVGNLIKYYSFAFLAQGKFFIYNISIVAFEVFKQIGGFLIIYFTLSWFWFFIYQTIVSICFYLVLKVGFKSIFHCDSIVKLKTIFFNLNKSFSFTKVIFFSSVLGAIMSSFDRAILSITFDENEIAFYSACFIVASIINMAIQPFHRLSLPLFVKLFNEGNLELLGKVLTSLCMILSMAALSMGVMMFLYAEQYMPYLLSSPVNQAVSQIILLLTISFWFIACGWLPANLLQVSGYPSFQMRNMLIALMLGGMISIFLASKQLLWGVTSVWIVHGCIQLFVVPVLSNRKCACFSISNWYTKVVIFPLISILTVALLSIFVKVIAGIAISVGFYLLSASVLILYTLLRFKNLYAKI